MLQLFFGADPAELAPLQAEAYRRELAELEAIKEGDTGDEPRAPWLALEVGIGVSRNAAELWEDIARRHRAEVGSPRWPPPPSRCRPSSRFPAAARGRPCGCTPCSPRR